MSSTSISTLALECLFEIRPFSVKHFPVSTCPLLGLRKRGKLGLAGCIPVNGRAPLVRRTSIPIVLAAVMETVPASTPEAQQPAANATSETGMKIPEYKVNKEYVWTDATRQRVRSVRVTDRTRSVRKLQPGKRSVSSSHPEARWPEGQSSRRI